MTAFDAQIKSLSHVLHIQCVLKGLHIILLFKYLFFGSHITSDQLTTDFQFRSRNLALNAYWQCSRVACTSRSPNKKADVALCLQSPATTLGILDKTNAFVPFAWP